MAYKGGCILGVKGAAENADYTLKFSSRNTSINGVSPNTLNGESTTLDAAWQATDGAWTPAQNGERSQASAAQYATVYAKAPSLSLATSWGLLFGYETKLSAQSYNLHTYHYSTGASSGFQSASGAQGLSVRPLMLTSSTRRLDVDFPPGAAYVAEQMQRSFSGTVCGALWQEAYIAFLQELPYNQELTTYRRTRTAPTSTEIKTMDGAIRRYVTGPASTSVNATWRWSDDGTIASAVSEILRIAAETLQPLIVYVPAGIYFDGPFLDLVMPTNDPAVIMPAPGTYEITIEGTCQP